MILANSDTISQYPAQLYYSALPFLPSDTYLTHQYPPPRDCISVLTDRGSSWSPLLFTLPRGNVAAFAPGGHMIAVPSEDQIQIYSALYGLLNRSIGRISSTDYIPRLAAFTEDESGIVVVLSPLFWCPESSYQIWKFNLVEGSGQMYLTAPREGYPLRLSEYGSYIAFAEHKNKDTQICIWKTDGTDDVSIPFGKLVVRDLDLAGESVHLVAVAAK